VRVRALEALGRRLELVDGVGILLQVLRLAELGPGEVVLLLAALVLPHREHADGQDEDDHREHDVLVVAKELDVLVDELVRVRLFLGRGAPSRFGCCFA